MKKSLIIILGLVAAVFCGAAIIISGMFVLTHAQVHVPRPPSISTQSIK